jgi:hypothetical protein
LPGTAQDSQLPSQAESQHTPSVQWWLRQSLFFAHCAPDGVAHMPSVHNPVTQSLLDVQVTPAPSLHRPERQRKPRAPSQSPFDPQLVRQTPALHE